MALLDIRQRAGYLFLAVMLGHVILISAQVNIDAAACRCSQVVTFGLFAEVQRVSSTVVSSLRGGWTNYVGLRDVRAENDALKRATGRGADSAAGTARAGRPQPGLLERLSSCATART